MERTPVAVICFLIATPLFAADGAIPIWEITTISEPGRYVLTRDIESALGQGIEITANDVDLDLNGFTISTNDHAIIASDISGLSIHDGKIYCVDDQTILLSNVTSFSLRRINARASDETVVSVSGRNGIIEELTIDSTASAPGIRVQGAAGIVIRDSVIRDALEGIVVDCTGCRVVDNLVSGSWEGVVVSGDRNHVGGNTLVDNTGFGLRLTGDENTFGDNMARGNAGTGCTGTSSSGEFCDEGAGNTSHGDNYMPGQM